MSDEKRGIPTKCRCGEKVKMRTAKTPTNPGRLFHVCPNGDEKNRFHLFKWTDESIVEEVEDLKPQFRDLTDEIASLGEKIGTVQKNSKATETFLLTFKKEVDVMKQKLEDCTAQVSALKNIVLVVVLSIVAFKYFM